MAVFALHPRLAGDTHVIGDLALSRLLLMNDVRFPWLILVPRRPDLAEITDLDPGERALLLDEIAAASGALRKLFSPDRINVAAIGNLVGQLHVHVVARTQSDAAWPATVWGHGAAVAYDGTVLERRRGDLLTALALPAERASPPA